MTNQEEIKVRVVNWTEIPKEHHEDILQTLSYGEYVDSPPYNVPNGLRTFRIPIYSKVTLYNKPDGINLPHMEFERVRVLTPNGRSKFIWRKV